MYKMHKVSALTVYQSGSNLSSVTLSDCFLAQPWNLSASRLLSQPSCHCGDPAQHGLGPTSHGYNVTAPPCSPPSL